MTSAANIPVSVRASADSSRPARHICRGANPSCEWSRWAGDGGPCIRARLPNQIKVRWTDR